MDLVRECLDKQLVDRHGQNMGRVDGLVLELEKGKPPRVAYVEQGASTLARRLHPSLARIVQRLSRWWGVCPADPSRIPYEKVVAAEIEVIVGAEAEDTPALAWELWLRKKVVSRIPGA